MCYVDLEPCELFEEKIVKAKKQHKCSCCFGKINVDENYLRHFSVFEGEKTFNKACMLCYNDRDKFAQEHDGMLCAPEWFENLLRDCIVEDTESEKVWKPILDRIVNTNKTK